MCVYVMPYLVNKQTHSRKGLLDTILGRNVDCSLKLYPIAFAAHIMHSNEWTGLNLIMIFINILEWAGLFLKMAKKLCEQANS